MRTPRPLPLAASLTARITALGLAVLIGACNGGDGKGGSDDDTEGKGARAGMYEVTFWSDTVDCAGGATDFAPIGILVELDDGVWVQTPCNTLEEDSCDVVRDQWNTLAAEDGGGGFAAVEDASFNQSASNCQLFYATTELSLNADGTARFDREVVTAAFQANGSGAEGCAELLPEWDRSGTANDCVSWEGTRVSP